MLDDRPTNVDLGRAVSALRKKHKWSGEELAGRASRSDSTISRLEGGKTSPTWDTIVAIAFAFGIAVEELAAHAASECFRRQSAAPPPQS